MIFLILNPMGSIKKVETVEGTQGDDPLGALQ